MRLENQKSNEGPLGRLDRLLGKLVILAFSRPIYDDLTPITPDRQPETIYSEPAAVDNVVDLEAFRLQRQAS
jgi:hypothetical protein